ncbi:Ppx/GppA phosphatase family protein [Paenibacillus filicis]|uniref:Ppx/GppA phosphatase family protein n=1 Tax=Paenibacillus gyeongsangnamensis TaxID=3388067 RepID=A0ABT4Q976_9BACL|nr:Ppx/GppA phosphatase family protein [Paenibacillus filicis]MCZ8513420.1 Ppx/GppA phosphatase family protein [Paenibacillus filicis]
MNSSRRIGIIDIGSNSIRLVIYEQRANGAYRVISEFKKSARLSQRIEPDGSLPPAEIESLVRILEHFRRICGAHQVQDFRVAATAAIRNATNSREIIDTLNRDSGFEVELLSGEAEARLGFLGMIRTMEIESGFLVDIGGGSTEISLFRARKLVRSVSFPFGAVNTTRRFSMTGNFSGDHIRSIRQMVEESVAQESWIHEAPGLPLVGLGGTIRTVCKINQRKRKYPLQTTHNYPMTRTDFDELVNWLPILPAEKRKKVDGLAKDRYDIIVPGMVILQTIFQTAGCSHYVVSGAGLRDGLYYETFQSDGETAVSVAEHSADNLLKLHSTAPEAHIRQVGSIALALYDAASKAKLLPDDPRLRLCFRTAAKLYRIGASLYYYQFAKHSFHLISQTRIDGFSHREILLCALIATFKAKNKTVQQATPYKDILQDADLELIVKLGYLLQLAIALDISEIQTLELTSAEFEGSMLHLKLRTKYDPSAEYREVEGIHKEFKKAWGVQIRIHEPSFSKS